MAPGNPQRRQCQETNEVDIELPLPAHIRNSIEEDRQQIPAVLYPDKAGIYKDECQNEYKVGAK